MAERTKLEKTKCPVCNRELKMLHGLRPDPVFGFHYNPRTGLECLASSKSINSALSAVGRIDYTPGATG
jgi:hypothetical protein